MLADALAKRIGAEIVSADSMQVYRGMDIGTAKTPIGQRGVTYHGIDLVDPGQAFTAALYQRYARKTIQEAWSRDHHVVFCGGSGLYLRAALDDFDLDEAYDMADDGQEGQPSLPFYGEKDAASPTRREQLLMQAEELGPEAFHGLLTDRDPRSAALIHPNNVRRVVRALELLDQGTSYAQASAGFARYESIYSVRFVGLALDRALLYQLIDNRVDAMIGQGLLGEVQVLISEGFREALTAAQAIGYKEVVPVLEGKATLKEATDSIKQATRRYAKRQMTWFSKDPRIEWLEVSDLHKARLSNSIDGLELSRLLLSRTLDLLK